MSLEARVAAVGYLAYAGFIALYAVFMWWVTDRGVLGWFLVIPAGVAVACAAMGVWSVRLARRKARAPWIYGVSGVALAVGVGSMTSTTVLVALLIPGLFAVAATLPGR